jgi:hypothetical protein
MAAGFECEPVDAKIICGDAVAGAIACKVVTSKALRKALNGVFTGNGAGLGQQLSKPAFETLLFSLHGPNCFV